MFATVARDGKPTVTDRPPRLTMDGQHTIMKLCAGCGQQMPHQVGAKVCILCAGEKDEHAIQPTKTDRLGGG
jgi:hypothetical protein